MGLRELQPSSDGAGPTSSALSHAVATCEPSERFDILIASAWGKLKIGDRQGAFNDFLEADNLGQLEFAALQ